VTLLCLGTSLYERIRLLEGCRTAWLKPSAQENNSTEVDFSACGCEINTLAGVKVTLPFCNTKANMGRGDKF
jgi:hypothetical protein